MKTHTIHQSLLQKKELRAVYHLFMAGLQCLNAEHNNAPETAAEVERFSLLYYGSLLMQMPVYGVRGAFDHGLLLVLGNGVDVETHIRSF